MSIMTGITNANQALAAEDLQGQQFKVVGAQIELNVDPASPVAVTSTAAGLKLTAADVQTVITGVGFPTAPPPVVSTDWVYFDTSKNTVTAIWDSVAGAWVQAGKGIWDKDLNTGITVEEAANENIVRAYVNGAWAGYVSDSLTGWGVNANLNNTGAYASAFGVNANLNNTGDYASAFGVSANLNNTGDSTSGFGGNANLNNTGASASAFGVNANLNNTGDYASGFGVSANLNNTGDSASGFGVNANLNNTGASASAFGVNANLNNTGASTSAFGVSANLNNTGDYASGFGVNANLNNTGDYASGFGGNANLNNTGDYASGFGDNANLNNTGGRNSGFGAQSLTRQRGSRNTGIGAYTLAEQQTFTVPPAAIDVGANTITIPAHNLGLIGDQVGFGATAGAPPAPLAVGGEYLFEVVDGNTLKPVGSALTAAPAGNFTVSTGVRRENTTAIGEGANPDKDNQVWLGGPGTTDLKTPATAVTFGQLPVFATDAAADAAVQSGQLYKLTGSRAVYQKP